MIVDAILHGHSRLLSQLDRSLRSLQPEPLKSYETWKRDVLTLRRNQFVNRRSGAKEYYLFHLCMDGYPRLILLQSLTPEDFEHNTLEAFYQFVTLRLKTDDWAEKLDHKWDLHHFRN
ncbi:hypothetical protein BFJ68_g5214 [Fusarium oxysporum]|uniref:Uncharacterized protein n=1 Tax=Fusarium oxysporum TaxID=5507 RepID=A0A420RHU6_FUSOX|nr:hypothetical protein BFJ66_g9034 [Fusarium oxysporum f. sp. cepae]RKK53736.1 hypothetical protein BFJ67_g5072 [Fusarium oxysporum f. sp. cepae]RKL16599.1 hypothetical protein BFJ68_g5214 [Fusarium oxysporum]